MSTGRGRPTGHSEDGRKPYQIAWPRTKIFNSSGRFRGMVHWFWAPRQNATGNRSVSLAMVWAGNSGDWSPSSPKLMAKTRVYMKHNQMPQILLSITTHTHFPQCMSLTPLCTPVITKEGHVYHKKKTPTLHSFHTDHLTLPPSTFRITASDGYINPMKL